MSSEPATRLPPGRILTVGTFNPSARFRPIDSMVCVYAELDPARTVLATFGPAGDPASVADSRLFAASPDMKAALRDMVNAVARLKDLPPELEAAAFRGLQAIFKAEGLTQ